MIAGIDGEHYWFPPGKSEAYVALNKKFDTDGTTRIWPWFKLTRLTGLYSLGEPQDVRDNRVGADGEIPRLGRRRGKTVVYEGIIKARSRQEFLWGRYLLAGALEDMASEGIMIVTWHSQNVQFGEETPRFFRARVLALEVVDEQVNRNHDRPFLLSLRMSDPHFYVAGDNELEGP